MATNGNMPPSNRDGLDQGKLTEEPPGYDKLHEASRRVLSSSVNATDDGRITVNLDSKIVQAFSKLIDIEEEQGVPEPPPSYDNTQTPWILPMNIVIQVVGSRGDVQPFVALGNELQNSGHRVRIATHSVFKTFVQQAGLKFFCIGGDPAQLMAYMVKNPGLIPNVKTLREGEIKRKRRMIREILEGCWRSCIEPDIDSGTPFVANAIIANPVSFAHIHCAQLLSIPLHLVFTMPWSPTRAFPHPLANIRNTSTDLKLANYLSYGLVQALTWQGLGGVINDFRKSLDLDVLPASEAPFLAETLKIPYTYCWSPALVPKPTDWASHIDVSGFIFRKLSTYEPSQELSAFLRDGPPPIYIGFGSIVVDNPQGLLAIVLEAVRLSNVRAIVSKGWSGLSSHDTPDDILFLGECPHEWLFQQVSAVVHHGGAGTTAAGLLSGKPTTIIPFFGDQPFWGDRIAAAGAGPLPIPYKGLTPTSLARAIQFCHTPQVIEAAGRIAEKMREENGVKSATASFYRHLPAESLRCDLIPTLPAVYSFDVDENRIKISSAASEILTKHKKVSSKHLKLYEPSPIMIETRRWDPITSAGSSGTDLAITALKALNGFWYEPYKVHQAAKKAMMEASITTATTGDLNAGEGSSKDVIPSTTDTSIAMVSASAKSFPKLYGALLKAMIIDTPVALAEGFRNAPRLYGEEVPDHQAVTDWKSGAVVGGKEFSKGVGSGLVDVFVQPYKGAKEDGALGFVAGVGKGAIGTCTKVAAGGLALWAYPAQGLWRSIKDVTVRYGRARKEVLSARRVHDLYHARRDGMGVDERAVLEAFERLVKSKAKSNCKRMLHAQEYTTCLNVTYVDGHPRELVIGFGTCTDSFREMYKGVNLIVFSGGGLWRPDTLDRYMKVYVPNDIWNWMYPGDDAAGVRSFEKLLELGNDRAARNIGIDPAADQAERNCIKDVETAVCLLPANSLEFKAAQAAANHLSLLNRQCLADFYISAVAVVYDLGVRVTCAILLPDRSFAIRDNKERKRELIFAEISMFDDEAQFNDMWEVVGGALKRMDRQYPAAIGECVAVYVQEQDRARVNGGHVPQNTFIDRAVAGMDHAIKNPTDFPGHCVNVDVVRRQRAGIFSGDDSKLPDSGNHSGGNRSGGNRKGEHGSNEHHGGEEHHGEHGGGEHHGGGHSGGRP